MTARRTVVTGAGSGIGRAVARRLSHDGDEVLGIDVAEAALSETFAGLAGATWVAADVRSDECLGTVDAFGAYDVLVNAAGILRRHAFVDHPLDDWQQTLDVNVRAPFRLSRHFAAEHLSRGAAGVIVNVCSTESFVGVTGHAAYTASKAALLMLTRAFALDKRIGNERGTVNGQLDRRARRADPLHQGLPAFNHGLGRVLRGG